MHIRITLKFLKNTNAQMLLFFSRAADMFLMSVVAAVVQSPSHVWQFVTPGTVALQASLSLTNSWSLPKFMFTALVMRSSHLILWCPLLLPSVFSRIFQWVVCLLQRPKHWSFSFSISSFSEYSGLVSLNINWFDLLAVQVTFRGFSSTTVWKHQLVVVTTCLFDG